MAQIENTSGRRYEINWKGAMVASVPRASINDVTGVKTNGTCEIADSILDDVLAGDGWTKGVFDSGDLVRVGAPAESVAVASPVDFAAPADLATSVDSKGKSKR